MITWGPLKAKMVKEGLLEEVAFNCKSQEKKKKSADIRRSSRQKASRNDSTS